MSGAAIASSSAPARPRKPALTGRVIFASAIGTTVEWYDFLLYGSAAGLVFGHVFFPKSDPLTGAMLSFATFGVGFLARPVGGIVFGHFGDRIGRKRILTISMLIMGIATFAIGLLPSYDQVGPLAPVLLVLLRLAQGFGLGGQWGGAILMSAEYGSARRRGLWTGFTQAGGGFGNFLAVLVLAVSAAVLPKQDFLAWGWRIAFLFSVVLIVIGLWVRTALEETPVFEAAVADGSAHKAPVLQTLKDRPWQILIGGALKLGENVSFYLMTAFGLTYLTDERMLHVDRSIALNGVLAGSAMGAITMPLWGWLSDRIGRRPVYGFGAAGLIVWGFLFFPLLQTRSPALITLAMMVGVTVHSAMNGPQGAFLAELFPTRIRYSGVSLCYQVTSIVGGSWAPIISVALWKSFHSVVPVSLYLALSCAVSLAGVLFARETKGLTFDAIDAAAARQS